MYLLWRSAASCEVHRRSSCAAGRPQASKDGTNEAGCTASAAATAERRSAAEALLEASQFSIGDMYTRHFLVHTAPQTLSDALALDSDAVWINVNDEAVNDKARWLHAEDCRMARRWLHVARQSQRAGAQAASCSACCV